MSLVLYLLIFLKLISTNFYAEHLELLTYRRFKQKFRTNNHFLQGRRSSLYQINIIIFQRNIKLLSYEIYQFSLGYRNIAPFGALFDIRNVLVLPEVQDWMASGRLHAPACCEAQLHVHCSFTLTSYTQNVSQSFSTAPDRI